MYCTQGKIILIKIHVDCGIYVVLKACSSVYALNKGQKIQIEILLKGYKKDLFVGSNLVDLNAKCCAAHEAWIIVKDVFAQGCYGMSYFLDMLIMDLVKKH